jgi:glycosyltransferase involved in cell wall biosynthesis
LEGLHPDSEIFDTVRLAQYAGSERTEQQICYLDDLFSERYRAMLDAAKRYPDVRISPLGNFATHVPRMLRPLAEEKRTQRGLMRMERALVRKSEDRTARLFPRSLLVNQREAEHLMRRANVGADRVQSIPPLISEPGTPARSYGGAPEFVFLGLLSLPHNDDGLRSFLTAVWPLVLDRLPGARLRVLGREPSTELRDVVGRFSQSVSLEGFVPDLGELFSHAAATINPLRFGSGIKLKVIEALGRGVPVVSTEIGAEGISSGWTHGILVADEPFEFADLMVGLTSIRHNNQVSEAARAHFELTYSRDAVFRRYDVAFDVT